MFRAARTTTTTVVADSSVFGSSVIGDGLLWRPKAAIYMLFSRRPIRGKSVVARNVSQRSGPGHAAGRVTWRGARAVAARRSPCYRDGILRRSKSSPQRWTASVRSLPTSARPGSETSRAALPRAVQRAPSPFRALELGGGVSPRTRRSRRQSAGCSVRAVVSGDQPACSKWLRVTSSGNRISRPVVPPWCESRIGDSRYAKVPLGPTRIFP